MNWSDYRRRRSSLHSVNDSCYASSPSPLSLRRDGCCKGPDANYGYVHLDLFDALLAASANLNVSQYQHLPRRALNPNSDFWSFDVSQRATTISPSRLLGFPLANRAFSYSFPGVESSYHSWRTHLPTPTIHRTFLISPTYAPHLDGFRTAFLSTAAFDGVTAKTGNIFTFYSFNLI